MDTDFTTTSAAVKEFVHTQDSGWGPLAHLADATGRAEERARAEALQNSALAALRMGDVRTACWCMARSLGVAQDLEPDAGPALLRELNAALAARHLKPMESWHAFNRNSLALLCNVLARQRETAAREHFETTLQPPVH